MAHQQKAGSLQHYDHVSLYESTFKTRKNDARFFVDLASEVLQARGDSSGAILELGAGAGRITLPLAQAGHDVIALDPSQPMLDRLSERLSKRPKAVQERVSLVRGDMRRFSFPQRFPLILATFNVIGHLEGFRDMGRFLRCAREHLLPGGKLVFDVPIPHPDEIEADPEELFPAPRFKHPETGEWIRQTERFEYDADRQVLLVESELRAEGNPDGVTIPLVLRQWFPKELEALLSYEKYSAIESFADYTPHPGLLAMDTLIFSATR